MLQIARRRKSFISKWPLQSLHNTPSTHPKGSVGRMMRSCFAGSSQHCFPYTVQIAHAAPPSFGCPNVIFGFPRATACSRVWFEEGWSACRPLCRPLAFPAVTPRPATGGPTSKTSYRWANEPRSSWTPNPLATYSWGIISGDPKNWRSTHKSTCQSPRKPNHRKVSSSILFSSPLLTGRPAQQAGRLLLPCTEIGRLEIQNASDAFGSSIQFAGRPSSPKLKPSR